MYNITKLLIYPMIFVVVDVVVAVVVVVVVVFYYYFLICSWFPTVFDAVIFGDTMPDSSRCARLT